MLIVKYLQESLSMVSSSSFIKVRHVIVNEAQCFMITVHNLQ